MGKKGNTEKKQAQKQVKQQQKNDKISKKAGKIFGDDNIDALLNEFAERDRQKTAVNTTVVAKIPARVNCAFQALSGSDKTIVLHGGESFNGAKVTTYSDLYTYNVTKNEFKHISAPNSPLRSAHTGIVVSRDNTSFLYCFAGDFTSPSQLFRHYNDIWICNLSTFEWEHLTFKNGPSQRSGHRAVYVKSQRKMYIFGGFNDNHQSIKYFSDLWVFDFDTREWTLLGQAKMAASGKKKDAATTVSPASGDATWPSARSGFGFTFHESTNGLILYGGYCTQTKKNSIEEDANVLSDLWRYDLNTNAWSQLKQGGLVTPKGRAGCTLFSYQNHILLFGGVCDGDDDTASIHYNDLLEYNVKLRKWVLIPLNTGSDPTDKLVTDYTMAPEQSPDDAAGGGDDDDDNNTADCQDDATPEQPEPAQTAARPDAATATTTTATSATPKPESWGWGSAKDEQKKLQQQQKLLAERRKQLQEEEDARALSLVGTNQNESDDSDDEGGNNRKKLLPVTYLWPRRNAMITVLGGKLFMYGGAFERENVEVTLDDFHCLDLKKVFKALPKNLEVDPNDLRSGNCTAYGVWMTIVESDLSHFEWFEEPEDDDDDDEIELDFDSDDDDDDDDDDRSALNVPSWKNFSTGKDYFKSCEEFWLAEAMSVAPENCTQKELRLMGFKLAKKFFAAQQGNSDSTTNQSDE